MTTSKKTTTKPGTKTVPATKATTHQRKAAVKAAIVEDAAANASAVKNDAVPTPKMIAATAKGTKAPKAPKAQKTKKVSGLDAAAQVLANAGKPMNCHDIVENMLAKGLWKTGGKTPHATIYSAMLREIDGNPGESRFVKTGRGLFGLASK